VTVDPKVWALAESFVDDTLKGFNRDDDVYSQAQRQAWIQQCAEAVQHTIELECQTLESYLEEGLEEGPDPIRDGWVDKNGRP
jgi:hypothetical protein